MKGLHRFLIPILIFPLMLGLPACNAENTIKVGEPPASSASAPAERTPEEKAAFRQEIHDRVRKRNGGKEPTHAQLLDELWRKGSEVVGAVVDYGKPRIVAKGAKPELIIDGESIEFNGNIIKFGDSLKKWKEILASPARCTEDKLAAECTWDNLGIQAGTENGGNKNNVKYINIHINQRPPDFPTNSPSYYSPKNPFPGYLELDGFGIDAKTQFWEIRSSVNPKRNMRCGLRDCSHPGGGSTDGKGSSIYMILNSKDDHGNIYEFSVSR
jgi:hypothetical protein